MNEENKFVVVWGDIPEREIFLIKEKGMKVVVPEQRPSLVGIEVAKQLRKHKVPCVCCPDNALGFLFYKQRIAEVVIFCKELTAEIALCQVGTYYLCLLAKGHRISVLFRVGDGDACLYGFDSVAMIGGKSFVIEKKLDKYIIKPETERITIKEFE